MKKSISEKFKTDGYIVLKNFLPKTLIKQNLNELSLIGRNLMKNFDLTNYKHIRHSNKKYFYKIINQNKFLYRFAVMNKLSILATKLGCKQPVVGPSYCRVDISPEKKHLFDWHQDYPNILGSKKMFTYWIPLTKVSKSIGSLEIIEKSHKLGILNCKSRNNKNKYTSVNMIVNKKIISKIKLNRTILELKPGDIAVLDPCILHRSHYNFKSSMVRLTNIIRLDDAGDKKHLSLGFKRTEIDKKNINYFKEYNF